MSFQMISNKQLIISTSMIILSAMMSIFLIKTIFDYLDLPEVWVNQEQCIKVINFKNGDNYTCQDKDVILRKYVIVNVN